jgi:hypothetical protein
MSFYRNFPLEDALIAEYLRHQERDGWAWWDSVVAAHEGDARAAEIQAHTSSRLSGRVRGDV